MKRQTHYRKLQADPQLKERIVSTLAESDTVIEAMARLKMGYNTLRRYALMFGVWEAKHPQHKIVPLQEILEGKHPTYSGQSLKDRLIRNGRKENKCEKCGINEWRGAPLTCQLDHIDGDNTNHRWENLRILCPNCHSQTPTYCKKKQHRK